MKRRGMIKGEERDGEEIKDDRTIRERRGNEKGKR
jgi:hypothetical protein